MIKVGREHERDLKGPNRLNPINIQTTKLFVSTHLKTPDLKIQVKVEER